MKHRIIVEVEVDIECDETDLSAAAKWVADDFYCDKVRYSFNGSPWTACTPAEDRSWRLIDGSAGAGK